VGAALLSVPHHHEANPADAAHPGFEGRHCEGRSNGCIHAIAARCEHICTNVRGLLILRGNNTMPAPHGLFQIAKLPTHVL
jgi:hypothetical protein